MQTKPLLTLEQVIETFNQGKTIVIFTFKETLLCNTKYMQVEAFKDVLIKQDVKGWVLK